MQPVGIQEPTSCFCQRQCDDQHIGLSQHIIQPIEARDEFKAGWRLRRNVLADGADAHVKGGCPPGDCLADMAKAQEAQHHRPVCRMPLARPGQAAMERRGHLGGGACARLPLVDDQSKGRRGGCL